MIIGPLRIGSSGKPSAAYRTRISWLKNALNHSAAAAVSEGNAISVGANPDAAPCADKVTELRPGAKVARIRCIAAVFLPLTHCPSVEQSAHTRSNSRPPPGPIRDSATEAGSSDLIGCNRISERRGLAMDMSLSLPIIELTHSLNRHRRRVNQVRAGKRLLQILSVWRVGISLLKHEPSAHRP